MRCWGLLAALLLSGCGRLLEITTTIFVPPEVQALYSEDHPGWLILSIDHPDLGRTISPSVICNPIEDTRDYAYTAGALGCASPTTITAWIEPWTKKGDPVCRANDDWLIRDPDPDPTYPMDRQRVWLDLDEADCAPVDAMSVSLELHLPDLPSTLTSTSPGATHPWRPIDTPRRNRNSPSGL